MCSDWDASKFILSTNNAPQISRKKDLAHKFMKFIRIVLMLFVKPCNKCKT